MRKAELLRSFKGSVIDSGEDGFSLLYNTAGITYGVVASWGEGWEHVSITIERPKQRVPTWDEMCMFKNLFWLPEETVVQYHPAKTQYVNAPKNVLHLWRPINEKLPTPPQNFV